MLLTLWPEGRVMGINRHDTSDTLRGFFLGRVP